MFYQVNKKQMELLVDHLGDPDDLLDDLLDNFGDLLDDLGFPDFI